MRYEKPLPKINSDVKPFWEGCKNHELRFQKCQACGHVRWPASIICPECHKKETEWIIACGHGTIYTYAVYHIAYHPGFVNDIPYVVAIVELDEGPHLLTNMSIATLRKSNAAWMCSGLGRCHAGDYFA